MSDEHPSNPVVVITGGTRGIGLLLAEHFLLKGSSVAVCARKIPSGSVGLDTLRHNFENHLLIDECDVTDATQLDRFADRVREKLGRPSVIIANAAILGPVGNVNDIDIPEFKRALEINVVGVLSTFKTFHRDIVESQRGRFLTLSGGGIGGPNPMARAAAYVASKTAIVTVVESLAPDLAPFGATINAIAPGRVPTLFMSTVLNFSRDSVGDQLYQDALDRSGEVDLSMIAELIDLLEYLISESGQTISGRLLSARWDTPTRLERLVFDASAQDLFRLRRIDRDLYSETR